MAVSVFSKNNWAGNNLFLYRRVLSGILENASSIKFDFYVLVGWNLEVIKQAKKTAKVSQLESEGERYRNPRTSQASHEFCCAASLFAWLVAENSSSFRADNTTPESFLSSFCFSFSCCHVTCEIETGRVMAPLDRPEKGMCSWSITLHCELWALAVRTWPAPFRSDSIRKFERPDVRVTN